MFFEHVQYVHRQKQDFTLQIYIFEHGNKYMNTFKKYWTRSKHLYMVKKYLS